MAFDIYTPARDDFTGNELPGFREAHGWTPEAVEQLQHLPRCERLAARLDGRDPLNKDKTNDRQ
jgi:hypothetical protein